MASRAVEFRHQLNWTLSGCNFENQERDGNFEKMPPFSGYLLRGHDARLSLSRVVSTNGRKEATTNVSNLDDAGRFSSSLMWR